MCMMFCKNIVLELKEEVLPIPEHQEYSNDLDYEEAFLDNLKNLNKSLN